MAQILLRIRSGSEIFRKMRRSITQMKSMKSRSKEREINAAENMKKMALNVDTEFCNLRKEAAALLSRGCQFPPFG